MKEIRQVGIRGIIEASEWDHVGNPTGITILTRDELEYAIECNEVGACLFDHLTREVVVYGLMRAGRDGTRILRPTSFAVLESASATAGE